MNNIQVFCYKGEHVRTVDLDGQVCFVAKDVCNILGLANPTKALKSLDNDEKMTLTNSKGHSGQRGGAQFMTYVNESGLYKLIFKSRKNEAKEFTRWVTHDVLPSIRRSGMYLNDKAADAYMNNPELFRQMAERCSALEDKVAVLEQALNKRYSFSVLGEIVIAQPGSITFKECADFLRQYGIKIGQNGLFAFCRDAKLLCARKGKQWNKPTQKAIDAGLFNIQISGGFNTITMITPKGVKYFTDSLVVKEYPLLVLIEQQGKKQLKAHAGE